MMDAVVMPTAKNRPARNKCRDIPPNLLEEMLLRLPMKLLLRFSSASKSWNSIILGSCFVNKYRGRQMIIFKPEKDGHLQNALVRPLSSVSPKDPLGGATPLIAPFEGRPYLVASCEGIWCVQVKNSLILWNPLFPTFRMLPEPWLPPWSKLPPWSGPFRYGCVQVKNSLILWNPSFPTFRMLPELWLLPWSKLPPWSGPFRYELGFDSANDDYKMLKICTHTLRNGRVETELYSLKSNSWRKIKPFPDRKIKSKFGLCVSGLALL